MRGEQHGLRVSQVVVGVDFKLVFVQARLLQDEVEGEEEYELLIGLVERVKCEQVGFWSTAATAVAGVELRKVFKRAEAEVERDRVELDVLLIDDEATLTHDGVSRPC